MKRPHKLYSRPKRPFEKIRIEEEGRIKDAYGLKNKKEIWRANAKIKNFREKAKKLISASEEEKQKLFDGLKKIGLKVSSIPEVLALEPKDYLERRLQTIIYKKRLASTMRGARQLIVHKKVLVGGNALDSPSYIVPTNLEKTIALKKVKKKAKEKKIEKNKEEIEEEQKNE
jgi:small subunit ribosomal protein S4